jgi:hypothetical protein
VAIVYAQPTCLTSVVAGRPGGTDTLVIDEVVGLSGHVVAFRSDTLVIVPERVDLRRGGRAQIDGGVLVTPGPGTTIRFPGPTRRRGFPGVKRTILVAARIGVLVAIATDRW